MLYELRVENLLLMERAELRLAPGLNMLTGETGAGKTLLAHALDLLLGGRARRGIVRPGAAEAYVEGVFELPPALAGDRRIPAGAQELVLARRVWPDGRTRAYLCGRAATQADLQELGGRVLSFYGQHEHRKLMLSAAQLELLDAYVGPEQRTLRAKLRDAYEQVRDLEGRAGELRELAGARDRELDLLAFELQEIEAAAPSDTEQASLIARRDRLRHQEALARAATVAADSLAGGGGGGDGAGVGGIDIGAGATELLADAAGQLEAMTAVDPRLRSLAERLETLRYESEDIAGELRGYLLELEGGGEADGAGLEEIEERLALLARLER
ncbi:MAG TPA: AAA family ATPase, partial [Solirubrobacteraceae bacterium]